MCNNQEGQSCIRARLDRCLINESWLPQYPFTVIQHLSRTLSDHAPLLISFRETVLKEPRPFRFQHMWIYKRMKISDQLLKRAGRSLFMPAPYTS